MKLVIVMMLLVQALCLSDRALLSLFESGAAQLSDLSQIDTQTIDCQYKGLVQLKDNLQLWSQFLSNKNILETQTSRLLTLKSQLLYLQPDQHDTYKQLVNDYIAETKNQNSNDDGIFEKWSENQAEYLQEGAQELDSLNDPSECEEKFKEVLDKVLESHDRIIEQYTNPPIDINVITQKADQITTITGNCNQGGVNVTVQKPEVHANAVLDQVQSNEQSVSTTEVTEQTQQTEQVQNEQPQESSFFEVSIPEEQVLVGQTA